MSNDNVANEVYETEWRGDYRVTSDGDTVQVERVRSHERVRLPLCVVAEFGVESYGVLDHELGEDPMPWDEIDQAEVTEDELEWESWSFSGPRSASDWVHFVDDVARQFRITIRDEHRPDDLVDDEVAIPGLV